MKAADHAAIFSKMKSPGWDDLQVFFHVARSGGLSAAARELGLSPPTVGRRMLALEQQTGQALFDRGAGGYRLTRAGQAVFGKVQAMQAAALPVQQLLSADAARPMIRLSAGTATAMFLADKIAALWRPDDPFRLTFVTSEEVLNVAHREIQLGIRNRPAEAGNLASRPLGTLRFAPYCSRASTRPEALDWVAMDPDHARHPAAHWVHMQGLPIAIQASTVATLHELIRAGAGRGVIPCMIADCDPALTRAGPVIEDLTETQYLVMHDDDRHQPHLRSVIGRLVRIYRDQADLLAGDRPLRG